MRTDVLSRARYPGLRSELAGAVKVVTTRGDLVADQVALAAGAWAPVTGRLAADLAGGRAPSLELTPLSPSRLR